MLLVAGGLLLSGGLLVSWPLLSLGFVQLSVLLVLYILFVPHAALLRRRQIEFAWWVPASQRAGGALAAGQAAKLHLLLRNYSPYHFGSVTMNILCSPAIRLQPGATFDIAVPAAHEVREQLDITPMAAGYWFFHGLKMTVTDRLGLFLLQAYFPNLLSIKVFPQLAVASRLVPFRPRTGASHERAGRRLLRQRGLGSDLRELRDHTPGDPFKRIAWKATARTGKLMVREFESEIVVTQWLLLDVSPSMRTGRPGKTKLDYGLALCAGLSRLAIESGDRVGLITFDTRIYTQVPPRDGKPQLYQLIDRLMELHNIVDEDLTDLTDAELYSAVADYLAYQEGVNVRVRGTPPPGSPLWDDIVQGVGNKLIDLDAMVRAVRTSLKHGRNTGAPSWWSRVVASSPEAAQLRLYCRLRGLEIPYRRPSPLAGKHQGMADAIARAATSRASRMLLIISDLEEIAQEQSVITSLGLARRRNHSIAVVAPYAPAFFETRGGSHEARVRNAMTLRHQRERARIKMSIERLGVPILSASPDEPVDRLLMQMARLRHRAA